MLSKQELLPILVKLEGKKSTVYVDSLGYRTVGIGFNMDALHAEVIWDRLDIKEDFRLIYNGLEELSDESIEKLLYYQFQNSYYKAAKRAFKLDVDFFLLPEWHQFILADIHFNTGSVKKWYKVFKYRDPKDVIYEARRKPYNLMDSRVAKIAYHFGLLKTIDEAISVYRLRHAKYLK